MRVWSGALRSLAAAWTALAVLSTPACASDWVAEAGRLRHPELGISLVSPAELASHWERIQVEGAELAYRGPDEAVMSFLRECGLRREASSRVAARQLLIGLERRRLLRDGALQVAAAPGWLQQVEAVDEGRQAQLLTVTRMADDCREDWVLATPGPPGPAAAVFDAWWRSYRPGDAGDARRDPSAGGAAERADAP